MKTEEGRWDNSYARLPERFYDRQMPVPVRAPELLWLNTPLLARLGLPEWRADWAAGNAVPEGAEPLAQAYAGHQFGGFSPQLGDGRALLLGEVVAPDGARFDLQLKGSGPTRFSRRGDGRAALGPVLREVIVSEAMAALGVPTTRALAAAATGEPVWRESALPGAVLTRVAASHIRVGTFQYFAARGDVAALEALTAHVIARHHPQAQGALDLLRAVMAAQARLVARWMGLGFIHGVMNTDNMTVSGETIDYGPCAFMDAFHPATVFSSIDRQGRYAYGNQPAVAHWNLAQLASCLVMVMGEEAQAVAEATEVLQGFPALYQAEWLSVFSEKIGLSETPESRALAERLLKLMEDHGLDFTATFTALRRGAPPAALAEWGRDWLAEGPDQARIERANPVRIPRNHRVDQALRAAEAGDLGPFTRLMAALAHPYEEAPDFADFEAPPRPGEEITATFCGT